MVVPALYEQSLKESEQKFRALAEASPAAIFIVQDGRITYANPMLAVLTGRQPSELIDMNPVDLVHPSERADLEARRTGRTRGDEAGAPFEVRIDTRSGDDCWVDLTTSQIVYDGGTAVVGTAIDISERKRLEQRMRQGQRLEAVGRLAGGVAHDFNNLLMVISGETERLLEALPGDSSLRGSVDSIARAAERAASLTQQLLAFGRRQMLIARHVDVNDVISEIYGIAGADGPVPALYLTPDLPPVRVDRSRLEQVLLNIVANAREAMGSDGSLTIATDLLGVDEAMREGRAWLPGGTWVRIQVTDSGPGIAADVMPYVFEPFFSTKGSGPARGLGLSAVYGIVKQSGGFVWIDSEPGTGTRVTILLPPAHGVSAAASTQPVAAAASPRVLLVEDEDAVRALVAAILERNGFDVTSTASAEAALRVLDGERFDVLLSDVMLPGMNGPALARRARRDTPDLRVLFMSGYAGDAVPDASEFGDERVFIEKPFGSRALVARIRSLLETR
jgi:two-component system, cell cycle sensor histidine kinase and response regulator CckA